MFSFLEDVGIAVIQLAQHPMLNELNASLIVIRLPEHRRISRVLNLLPDSIAIHLNKTDAHLCDVGHD